MLWNQSNKSALGVLLAYGGVLRIAFLAFLGAALWSFAAGFRILPLVFGVPSLLLLWIYRSSGRLVPEAAPILAAPVDGRISNIENNEAAGRLIIHFSLHWRDSRVVRSPVTGPVKAVQPDGTLALADTAGGEVLLAVAPTGARPLKLGPTAGDEVELGVVIGFCPFGRGVTLVIPEASGFEVIARPGVKALGGQTIVAVRRDTRAQNVYLESS